ncbi:polymorphic toxin-type HINT domain-containing protein [Streptomyces sp. NBC_00236]|uniref:polymorphic toxin-type HINT domain-containing protein n=1 Tax=Streptomyces sp. NBC_00236 TaxID=2903639 RepID=UPI002E2E1E66|nr:polymorphic toxin-type HINT domain-containing protein [Streptomyces sp. NBC_00236]
MPRMGELRRRVRRSVPRTQARVLGLRRRRDRGQGALEYLGLTLVVVAIIGALVGTGIGADLTAKIGVQVCRIGGGGNCGGDSGSQAQGGDQSAPGQGDPASDKNPDGSPKSPEQIAYDKALKDLQDAQKDEKSNSDKAIDAAKELAKILADELGITDALDCITKGDMGACTETLINVLLSLVGGAVGKLAAKYGAPWKWKKAYKLIQSLKKHGGDLYDGLKGLIKSRGKVKDAQKALDDAAKKLDDTKKPKKDDPKPDEKKPDCPVNHSFLAGTPVLLADGTRRAIEDVRAGDRVLATDPADGRSAARTVTDTITTEGDKHFTRVTVEQNGRTATLTATDTHPFWLVNEGRWADAGRIAAGDALRLSDGGALAVTGVSRYTLRQRTHDLTVDTTHTYYVAVGRGNVLVHNNDCGPKKRTPAELKKLAEENAQAARDYQDVFLDEVRREAKAKGKSPEEVEKAVEWAEKTNTTSVVRARFPVPGKPGQWVERNVVSSSGQGLSPAQLSAIAKRGDVPVRVNVQGATHAEQNALLEIDKLGGKPIAGGASREVCQDICGPLIKGSEGVVSGNVTGRGGRKYKTFWWP